MASPATRFAEKAPGVRSATAIREGDVLHVYAASLTDVDREVKIYALAPDATDVEVRKAFEQAAAVWDKLGTRTDVVSVCVRGENPRPWIAIEDEGTPLSELQQPLDRAAGQEILADLAEACRHVAHTEFGPPGLTPDRVRIVRSGERVGAGMELNIERACRIGAGKKQESPYTPPELRGGSVVDADLAAVYELGAIAHYAFGDDPPTAPGDARQRSESQRGQPQTSLPAGVADVVETALASAPTERYRSPYEFKLAVLFDLSPEEDQRPPPRDGNESHASDPATDEARGESAAGEAADSTDQVAASGNGIVPSVSRRTALGALGLGTIGAVGGGAWLLSNGSGLLGTATDSEGAPLLQYDAANTGHAPGETGPSGDVTVDWSFQTGDTVVPFAVVDETVYVGSLDNTVYALDTTDGTERWSIQNGKDDDSSAAPIPSVVDGTVIVKNGQGVVRALSRSDGTQQWRFDESNGDAVTPVSDGDAVYVSGKKAMYALDPGDGTELWTAEIDPPTALSPAIHDDTLFYGTENGIIALDTADGSERWSSDIGPVFLSSPTVAEGTVFIGTQEGNLYALDAGDGTERWSNELAGPLMTTPAVANGRLFIGERGTRMHALDTSDGTERWSLDRDREGAFTGVRVPIVADGTLYVGSGDGKLYALDASDGTERWSVEVSAERVWAPVVLDGTLYAIGDQTVFAFRGSEPS